MGACFVCPETGTKAVVTRFGRFSHVVEPGCHCLNPLMCQVVAGTVSLRVRESRHAIDVKTKDNVFLTLSVAIQYEVIPDKVYEAFYKLQNPQSQMEAYVVDVVRAHIPRLSLDMVFVEKENLSQQIRTELGEAMASYGYLILKTLITDIDPSSEVKQAMNEIVKQQRLKMAAEFKGEATRILAVKTAQAEGEKIRIQAAADAEAKYLNGQGIARQRAAIINGMRDDVSNFSTTVDNVGAREVLHLIVLTQYLDTLRDVASKTKSNSMFVPHGPGSVSALSDQIRSGFLHANEPPS